MFNDTSRSIAETFNLNQQTQKTLSSEDIAEIAAMKKVIINCFENPDWDSCGTYHIASVFIQTFGETATTAFLDVLFERHNNNMIDPTNLHDFHVIQYFWNELTDTTTSEADLLRITEILMWENISSNISLYNIIDHINEFGTATLIPNLERARDSLSLSVATRRELEETIIICRSRT
jgi:hypothetical protein